MGTLALIGLGSNLGDRTARLDAAVAALAERPGCLVRAVSSYHETDPVGGPEGQGAFLNAAASVETTLDPVDLLHVLQDIERRAGRVRVVRWGERTLDLDLLLFGDRLIKTLPIVNRVFGGQSVELQVPHPRMALRRFVLAPLAEIAPRAVDPLTRRSIADLLANLDRRPSLLAIHDPYWKQGLTPLADLLFPRLVETLRATGLTFARQREAGREISEIDDLFACDELRIERAPVDPRGGRWVVSDFWPDAVFAEANAVDGPSAPSWDRLLAMRAEVIAPTFVVVPHGWRGQLSRARSAWPAPLGDAPILEVNPDGPAEVVVNEVLAACQATRAG